MAIYYLMWMAYSPKELLILKASKSHFLEDILKEKKSLVEVISYRLEEVKRV